MASLAGAQDNATEESNLVPYKMAKLDDPRLKEIWTEAGEKEWQSGPDIRKYAKIAEFKNDLGEDVLMSMRVDRQGCATFDCPVRIVVSGETIFDDFACRFDDEHTLTRSRNSVFLCDVVVPLRESKVKEK
jgi:hypothetical protein